jgi:alpha-galactosidase
MTTEQYITHFSFWAAFKSPLLIGTDLSTITKSSLQILTNEKVINVHQDPLVISINRDVKKDRYQIWSGPLSDEKTVVLVLNPSSKPLVIDINLSDIMALHSVKPTTEFKCEDLWTNELFNVKGSFTRRINGYSTFMAILRPKYRKGQDKKWVVKHTGTHLEVHRQGIIYAKGVNTTLV